MNIVVVLTALIAVASAFDCFGRNNSCAESRITCDTGYDPFCEHMPGPEGRYFGICTCDKACNSASDCANTAADGCPERSHPMCSLNATIKVCHCFGPHPPPPESNSSN